MSVVLTQNLITEARMFAMLSAANEAILRTESRDELFQRVCDGAVTGGGFKAAVALLVDDDHWLRIAAACGCAGDRSRGPKISVDPQSERGNGLAGTAFRTGRSCFSNEFQKDERVRPWRDEGRGADIGAAAAVPILMNGASIGVFLFSLGHGHSFTDQILALIERMVENVSFALRNFEREDERKKSERVNRRVSDMFAALSATNEAIMRARSRDELLEMVCEAAVLGDTFICARIAFPVPGGANLRIEAASGRGKETAKGIIIPLSSSPSDAVSASEIAFRTGKPCICNDYLADTRMTLFKERLREFGTRAVAAFPLFKNRQPIGQITLQAGECDAFAPELADLLQRLADNVSFALENFDRADEKREAERRIEYLATHDGLTGLPNRVMFNQLLEQSIKQARRRKSKCAVLFIDLDRFKVINDSLGHTAGDQLLIEVAARLRGAVRSSNVVARLGGDEFVVILNDVADHDQVAQVAGKLLSSLVPALDLAGHECRVTGSIGIAMFPDNGIDAHTLTKNADMAMYHAKEQGKNDYRFFSTDIKSQSIERLMLETSLRHALELGQLSLHYQPKIDVLHSGINGVEALLRWTHPDLGNLPPMKFIPLAEETGLIIPIGRWVLKTACEQSMKWRRQGLPPLSMAINLSPRQFQDDNLLSDIDDVLEETGMPAHLLQLEITESMVMQNVDRGIRLLDAIQSRGVRLAIDDFGTGYSSMSMMKRFPIDTIKIDRSFIRDLERNAEDRAIAAAIINMGKALGLTVVAEGVETGEQDAFLRGHSCDELQGYLFSRPIPADQIPALVRCATASRPTQPGNLDMAVVAA